MVYFLRGATEVRGFPFYYLEIGTVVLTDYY